MSRKLPRLSLSPLRSREPWLRPIVTYCSPCIVQPMDLTGAEKQGGARAPLDGKMSQLVNAQGRVLDLDLRLNNLRGIATFVYATDTARSLAFPMKSLTESDPSTELQSLQQSVLFCAPSSCCARGPRQSTSLRVFWPQYPTSTVCLRRCATRRS